MSLEQLFYHVSVIGACGKMGSGISYLVLRELAKKRREWHLTLIDLHSESFSSLKNYLEKELVKDGEKKIDEIRLLYPNKEDKTQLINHYVEEAMTHVTFSDRFEHATGSSLVFEAIFEDFEAKIHTFQKLKQIVASQSLFLTNTSAIPITKMAETTQLQERLFGFHFYNPPAIQRLLEIIVPKETTKKLKTTLYALAKTFDKTVVFSEDYPGFIGNGYMIPECLFTLNKAEELADQSSLTEAIFFLNGITEKRLIRPMGIFQLMDYVGLDVVDNVLGIMRQFLNDPTYNHPMIENMLKRGIKGGQKGDGTQCDGFFSYEKLKPRAIYDFSKKEYRPLVHFQQLSTSPTSWSQLKNESNNEKILNHFFSALLCKKDHDSQITRQFLEHSAQISWGLVERGVAANIEDVSQVLKLGFHHLFGPDAPWMLSLKPNIKNIGVCF
jgi:3-hydroxyacyl-CoA dehydrogenase